MIRTTITPQNTDLHITIPQEYVGKELELLVYTIDEGKQQTNFVTAENTIIKLLKSAPIMSEEEYNKFQEKRKHLNKWK
jgi:hypothetical protein